MVNASTIHKVPQDMNNISELDVLLLLMVSENMLDVSKNLLIKFF